MKISTIGCVLISLGINVASGLIFKRKIIDFDVDEDDWEIEHLSSDCKAEVEKSLTCLRKIESGIDSKEEYLEGLNIDTVCLPYEGNTLASLDTCKKQIGDGLNTICSAFADDSCKDLLAENSVVNLIKTSKCMNNDYDLSILAEIAAVKSAYLMGCSKNKSGDLCPLSKYLTTTAVEFFFNNFVTIDRLLAEEYEVNNEVELGLSMGNDIVTLLPFFNNINEILIETCKDNACNKNVVAIDNIILAAKATYEKLQNTNLSEKFPKVFEFYDGYLSNFRNQKCKLATFVNEDVSGASTTKKITYSFVAMTIAFALLLL